MKKILLLIVLINIFTYANSKKILIINSYSRDFEWTENQLRGIENYFYGKENIDFFYEYLDNKNIDSEEYLEQYKKIFKEKYKNQTLDLIVTTDDFALSFIRDNYLLLKKVPYVIASGVNHEFPIEENVTILYEKFDIEKNLNLIKRQNSQINTIYFVADSSYSSKGLIEDVKKITDNDKRYEYIWLDEDFFKLKKELTKLKENSAIIHLIYFKDEQGITSKYERTLRELYKDTKIPIYTSFNFYLEEENNVLGGYSIDGYKMGETVGKLVEDYFNGKELSHTIVDSGLYSTYKFNYKVLEKNKIKYIIDYVDLIQSVHEYSLLEELDKKASQKGRILDVLLEVNISGEESKHGFEREELLNLGEKLVSFSSVRIKGLMTMAPNTEDLDIVRGTFRGLREFRDELNQKIFNGALTELSMGMSNDYRIALEEGATIIRIGTRLFN